MNLNITGHHLDLTPALHAYVVNKLERTAGHNKDIYSAHFVLSLDGAIHKAQATMHTREGEVIGEAEDHDMYAAIDQLMDKLDRQLIRNKEIYHKQ